MWEKWWWSIVSSQMLPNSLSPAISSSEVKSLQILHRLNSQNYRSLLPVWFLNHSLLWNKNLAKDIHSVTWHLLSSEHSKMSPVIEIHSSLHPNPDPTPLWPIDPNLPTQKAVYFWFCSFVVPKDNYSCDLPRLHGRILRISEYWWLRIKDFDLM